MLVTRRQFIDTLTRAQGSINLANLPPRAAEFLSAHGVDPAALREIARDGVLSGADEIGALYDRLASHASTREGRGSDLNRSREMYAVFQLLRDLTGAPAAAADVRPPSGAAAVRPGLGAGGRRSEAPAEAPEPQPGPQAPRDTSLVATGRGHFVSVPQEIDVRADQLAGLAAQRRQTAPRAYLDAIEAWDARQSQRAAGQRQTIGRPEGVPADIYNLTRAVGMQGVTSLDARHFLATGQLPDLLDSEGRVSETGDDRLARIERDALNGSWPAVNTLTFLYGMRESALASEAAVLEARLPALAADDPARAEINTAVTENRAEVTRLSGRRQAIYRAATTSRETRASGLVSSAGDLERRAEELRGTRPDRAEELERRAALLRSRGTEMAVSEGRYRAGFRSGGALDASRAYQIAARGQIDSGRVEVRRLERSTGTLPQAVPEQLGDAERTSTGLPGAGFLTAESRRLHRGTGGADADQTQLALEQSRHSAIGDFHRLHLQRGGFYERARSGDVASRAPSASTYGHYDGYVGARLQQVRAQTRRLELYGPAGNLDGRTALQAGGVSLERQQILGELAGTLEQGMVSSQQLTDAREHAEGADRNMRAAGDARDEAARQEVAVRGRSTQTRSDAEPLAGGLFMDSHERGLSRDAVSGANVQDRTAGANADYADRQAREAVTSRNAAYAEVERLQAQEASDRETSRHVVLALRATPIDGGRPPMTGREAARRVGAAADRSAEVTETYLARAQADAPRDPALREQEEYQIGTARLGLSRHWMRSAEVRSQMWADAPSADDRRTRLDRSAVLLDRVDASRRTLAPDSAERRELAIEAVDARAELGEYSASDLPAIVREGGGTVSNASVRHPANTRDQLVLAEATAREELTLHPELAGTAFARIGSAAITAYERSSANFDQIVQSGHFVPGANGELVARARRLMPEADANLAIAGESGMAELGRMYLAAGRERLGRLDTALDQVEPMLGTIGRQLGNGQEYSEAVTRDFARGELQAVNMSSSILVRDLANGVAWAVDGMTIEEAHDFQLRNMIGLSAPYTARTQEGGSDLALGFRAARREGREIDFLDSMRIMSDRSLRETAPAAYGYAGSTIHGFVSGARGDDSQRWASDFYARAVRDRDHGVPLAQAFRGSPFQYEAAMRTFGDDRLAIVTADMSEMMTEANRRFDRSREGLEGRILVNTGLEVALGVVLTGGLGSAAAVGEGANALNTLRTAGQLAQTARSMTALARLAQGFRALHPIARGMITTAGVGGGMMLASHGVHRLAGPNTRVSRMFDVATNFVPIGAGHRALRAGQAVNATEHVLQQAPRLSALSSRAAIRESLTATQLLAHGRMFGSTALLAAGQAVGVTYLTPRVAQTLGLDRSELGQAAIGLVLNVLATGAVGSGQALAQRTGRRAPHEALVDVMLSGREGAPGFNARRARERLTPLVEEMITRTEGRMPTPEEVSTLRTRAYEELGLSADRPEHANDRILVDSAVEGLRIQRATQLSMREAGIVEGTPITEAQARQAMELTGERLYTARGGETGGASRVRAYQDASISLIERTGPRNAAAGAAMADRSRAVELSTLLSVETAQGQRPAISSPEQRARVETIFAEEMGGLRRGVEGTEGAPSFDRLRTRLETEGGLSRTAADEAVGLLRTDLADRGVVTRLVREQETRGAQLSPDQIETVARDVATRAGMDPAQASSFAGEMSRSSGVREFLSSMILGPRYAAMNPAERQADFLRRNPSAGSTARADGLGRLTPEQFRTAFGDGPYHSRLADLGAFAGFEQYAINDPAGARRMYQHALLFPVAAHLRGQTPPNFAATTAHFDQFRVDHTVQVQGTEGSFNGQTIDYRVTDLRVQGFPALRLSPSRPLDHNGAFFSSGETPRRFGRSGEGYSDIPRDFSYIRPDNLQLPNGQRATDADMNRVAMFGGHGATEFFTGLRTADAARLMADQLVAYRARNPGNPAIEFVVLEACSQGTRRGPLGLTGETNAAQFQRDINAVLQAQGHPPVTILAAERAGVLYGNRYAGYTRGPGGAEATFVDPSQQRGGIPRETWRRIALLGGAGALLAAGGAGGAYVVAETLRRRERERPIEQTPPAVVPQGSR
jgi:hypothetical protein